jgi:hypothetical protein
MNFEAICVDRQVIRRSVSVAAHHPLGLPSGEFLQREERRSAPHIPARPGMPQVVPAEGLDIRALNSMSGCPAAPERPASPCR